MSYHTFKYIIEEERANRRLVYVLILIMLMMVLSIWGLSWYFNKQLDELKYNDTSMLLSERQAAVENPNVFDYSQPII